MLLTSLLPGLAMIMMMMMMMIAYLLFTIIRSQWPDQGCESPEIGQKLLARLATVEVEVVNHSTVAK